MVFETIRKLLADQLDLDPSEITMDSTLLEDLGADSIELVDLVMSVEEEYGIEVPDDAMERIQN